MLKFKVYIEPGLDETKIRKALLLVPNFFSFEFDDWENASYYSYSSGDWKNFIMPETDNTIIFFDGKSRKVNYAGGTLGTRVGIAVFGDETIEILGLRVYHELLHTLGLPADDMLTNGDFAGWLPLWLRLTFAIAKRLRRKDVEHNPKWQNLYYDFLLMKYLEGR